MLPSIKKPMLTYILKAAVSVLHEIRQNKTPKESPVNAPFPTTAIEHATFGPDTTEVLEVAYEDGMMEVFWNSPSASPLERIPEYKIDKKNMFAIKQGARWVPQAKISSIRHFTVNNTKK